ncbi:MAG: hypothetical protein V1839_01680 [archaeon]
MKLDDLLLKKEELPIRTIEGTLSNPVFTVPIHPKLLSPDVKIDSIIASKVFSRAAKEWYTDLNNAIKNANDADRTWIKDVFLKKKAYAKLYGGNYILTGTGWQDDVLTNENGFATSLSISRNSGGTLYLDPNSKFEFVHKLYVRFSPEKFREYRCENFNPDKDCSQGTWTYVYSKHNIDYYPGALFLRNWAILYLNEAMKQAFSQKPF